MEPRSSIIKGLLLTIFLCFVIKAIKLGRNSVSSTKSSKRLIERRLLFGKNPPALMANIADCRPRGIDATSAVAQRALLSIVLVSLGL